MYTDHIEIVNDYLSISQWNVPIQVVWFNDCLYFIWTCEIETNKFKHLRFIYLDNM